jgi:tRNA (guanine37-N1)-methyltransferase
MQITILTAYPEIFPGALECSVIGNALKKNIWSLKIINLHDFGFDERKSIDDEPFGGGPGMVIRPDVVEKSLLSLPYNENIDRRLIYMTPSGKPLNQSKLAKFSQFEQLIILCGRFEGVDQRAIEALKFEEISIGDYILAGGEIPAQVLVEGCIRLLPGVLGQPESLLEESFSNNLLEYPQYTRPQVWKDSQSNDHEVPKVLLSGHHEKIKQWRSEKSIQKTNLFRPDLLKKEKKERK